MAILRMSKIRGFIAGAVVLVLLIVFAAIVAAALKVRVPLLSSITDAIGMT